MAIKLISGTEDVPKPLVNLTVDDQSAESWWGGVFRSGVSIAVATAAAAVAFTTAIAIHTTALPQDDPSGNLYHPVDEVYWQNPVAPTQLSFSQPIIADSDFAQAPAAFQPDEDYWSQPPPTQAAFISLQPWSQDEPAGNLYNPIEEYYWQNPVAPVQATLGSLYSFDDAIWVAPAVLPLSPDEDFWTNPVQPIQASFASLYLPDGTDVPAGNLFVPLDEDFWANSVQPVPATFGRLYAFDAGEWVAPASAPIFDEDYWQNPVFPTQMSLYFTLPLGDHDEIPAGSLTTPPPPPTGKPNSIRMGIFNV